MLRFFVNKAMCTVLALVTIPAHATIDNKTIEKSQVRSSPDSSLYAKMVFLKKRRPDGTPENRVEIRNSGSNRLIVRTDYSSSSGTSGYSIRKAGWTSDSHFFVYILASSGGHSPWHHPICFYSRRHRRFYSLDKILASMGNGPGSITGHLELKSNCVVITKARYYGKSRNGLRTSIEPKDTSGEQIVEIDLNLLQSHLNPSAEDKKFYTP